MNAREFQQKLVSFMVRHDFTIREMSVLFEVSEPNMARYVMGHVLPPAAEMIVKFVEIEEGRLCREKNSGTVSSST